MKIIVKPDNTEYALFYEKYLEKVSEEKTVLNQLKENSLNFKKFLLSLSEEQLQFRYATGKWCIKDIVMHIIDVERVFLYRAMRFARKDKTPLPFFNEDDYAKEARADKIAIKSLVKEYMATRAATMAFFNNVSKPTLKNIGIASNAAMSVRATAWIICGHELHHTQVIKEKYLV
jgi:uncharacterized damage-inducible protein DinB